MGTDFLYHNGTGLSKGHADWSNGFESCQLTSLYINKDLSNASNSDSGLL